MRFRKNHNTIEQMILKNRMSEFYVPRCLMIVIIRPFKMLYIPNHCPCVRNTIEIWILKLGDTKTLTMFLTNLSAFSFPLILT